MDHRLHEVTSELKHLQQVVDHALKTVRPLRQATDTMLRELWQMRQEIVSATAVDAPSHQPHPSPAGRTMRSSIWRHRCATSFSSCSIRLRQDRWLRRDNWEVFRFSRSAVEIEPMELFITDLGL